MTDEAGAACRSQRSLMPSASSAPLPPPAPQPSVWLWITPLFAFVLFITTVGGVLWFYQRADEEEQRTKMVSDALWLEQNLRFQFARHAEILGSMRPEQVASAQTFEAQAAILLASDEGLLSLAWYDRAARPRRVYPGLMTALLAHSAAEQEIIRKTQKFAQTLGHAVFDKPHAAADGDWLFDMHVPVFHNGRLVGVCVAAYSLRKLLGEAAPWWLAERYRIDIADADGNPLAERSKIGAAVARGAADESHQVALDPPGNGLVLRLSPYAQPRPLAAQLLPVSLILLALLVLWSLFVLRRHVNSRLRVEKALREEYALRRAMDESLHTGMRALDLSGRISYVNSAFCRMVGYPAQALLGSQAPQPWWPPEEQDNITQILAKARASNTPHIGVEMRLMRKNGERFDALLYEAPLIDAQGNHAGWMGSLLDITERKRVRELARQHEDKIAATARLVSMGEMASSLAHELSQPLTAINGYAAGCVNLLAAPQPNLAELRQALVKCSEQAQRAGMVIRRIYEFVRRAEPKSEPGDLSHIVSEMVALIDADARRQSVRIVRRIAADLPKVQCDRVLIGQAILNLLKNAIEAMDNTAPENKVLTVCVEGGSEGEGNEVGSGIRVTIADQGRGVSTEEAQCLFEPFYTTKSEGMGMGLNICRSVIEAHHGRLDYTANPARAGGSIFYVWLPCRAADA